MYRQQHVKLSHAAHGYRVVVISDCGVLNTRRWPQKSHRYIHGTLKATHIILVLKLKKKRDIAHLLWLCSLLIQLYWIFMPSFFRFISLLLFAFVKCLLLTLRSYTLMLMRWHICMNTSSTHKKKLANGVLQSKYSARILIFFTRKMFFDTL